MSLAICFLLSETIARIFVPDLIRKDERNIVYQYDKELGWSPIPDLTLQFEGSRSIHVSNNKNGFRDIDHGKKLKKRIAFLGDSFVWGYDVESEDRFTNKLQKQLPGWEIFNLGISGYGSDQEYLLLQKWFDNIKPDVVICCFTLNDWQDNRANSRYGGYFKPYFEYDNFKLIKKGVPVPKGLNYYSGKYPLIFKSRIMQLLFNKKDPGFRLSVDPTIFIFDEMNKYVTSKGSKFYLAITDQNKNDSAWMMLDFFNVSHFFISTPYKYNSHGNHWTPEGHRNISFQIYQNLKREKIIY